MYFTPMTVDVVIPCYNELDNLLALSEHLSNCKDINDVHLIIADSPKTDDGTKEFCESNSLTHLKCREQGRAEQMNEGAFHGKSDFILFLHADVRPPLDFIPHLIQANEAGYEAGFYSYRFDKASFLLRINANFTGRDSRFAGGGDQCQFMTRKLFQQLGMYDESYCIMEDFDMIRRWRNNDIRYKIIQSQAIVSARKYKNGSYLKVNYMNLRAFLMFRKGIDPKEIKAYYSKLLRR